MNEPRWWTHGIPERPDLEDTRNNGCETCGCHFCRCPEEPGEPDHNDSSYLVRQGNDVALGVTVDHGPANYQPRHFNRLQAWERPPGESTEFWPKSFNSAGVPSLYRFKLRDSAWVRFLRSDVGTVLVVGAVLAVIALLVTWGLP